MAAGKEEKEIIRETIDLVAQRLMRRGTPIDTLMVIAVWDVLDDAHKTTGEHDSVSVSVGQLQRLDHARAAVAFLRKTADAIEKAHSLIDMQIKVQNAPGGSA